MISRQNIDPCWHGVPCPIMLVLLATPRAHTWRGQEGSRDGISLSRTVRQLEHVSIALSHLCLSVSIIQVNNLQYFNILIFSITNPPSSSLSLSNLQSKNISVSYQECGWTLWLWTQRSDYTRRISRVLYGFNLKQVWWQPDFFERKHVCKMAFWMVYMWQHCWV